MKTSNAADSDVIVIGGGMSGLAAALAAGEKDATVSVIEADTVPGGSARWSSGRIWTLPDLASFRQMIPLGDDRLQRFLSGTIEDALDWLAASVGHLVPQPAGKSGVGRSMTLGYLGNRSDYFAAFAQCCEAAGVRFLYDARFVGIDPMTSDVFTVRVETGSKVIRLTASSIVLATGGFQGDRKMLAEHFGPEAERLMVRSNPHSRGDGVRAGREMSGALSRGTSAFYGKSMPLGAECLEPEEYKTYTFDVARHATAVSIDGRRFVDEASGISSEAITNAAIYQPEGGRYFLLVDGSQSDLLQSDALPELAERTGRPVSDLILEAASPAELCELMAAHWGVNRDGLQETIAAVDQAAAQGNGQDMLPPRRHPPTALRTAPLRAVACRPAITIPLGGLAVNETMALLSTDGTSVPGIFVAGADAGGPFYGAYAGGLAWALASGRMAGKSAVASIESRKNVGKGGYKRMIK